MYPTILPLREILDALAQLDVDLASETRQSGCPRCGGALHSAAWVRKPRGAAEALLEGRSTRWGLCCGSCRRRALPPSVLFCGRHVYLKAVILLVVAARQGSLSPATLVELQRAYGVSPHTVRRWLRMFLERLPASPAWTRIRGRISARVRDEDVPAGLLTWLVASGQHVQEALLTTCRMVPAL